MKKFAMAVLSVLALAGFVTVALAQENSRGTSTLTINGKTLSVEYGRPALKGRTTDQLLGNLPVGGFWRLGSNASTTFKTGADLAFGDVAVPAGEYSLWMQRKGDTSWNLVFNKQHGQFGTDHDASQDFASVPLTNSTAAKPVETVTIKLAKAGSGGTITIEWGTLQVAATFKAK